MNFTVAFLDLNKVTQLLYSLAHNKTLAEKSQMSVDQVSSVVWAPTSVSYGDNFSTATFKKWVAEEYMFQLREYLKACERGPAHCLNWLEGRAKARNAFYRNNISTQQEFANINNNMANIYTALMREAAVVQFAAETALVGIGLFASAPASLTILAGRVVVGIGSGFAISIAEQWATAKNCDMLLSPVSDTATSTLASNLPSVVNDTMNTVDGFSRISVNELENGINNADRSLRHAGRQYRATTDPAARSAIKDNMGLVRSQRNKDMAQLRELKAGNSKGNLSTTAKAAGKTLTIACWALALKSEKESIEKLIKHWNGKY